MAEGGRKFYKKKWYTNKKKPGGSAGVDKGGAPQRRTAQPVNPTKPNNVLSFYVCGTAENPYYGWKLFFHNEEYKENSLTVQKVRSIESFISRQQHLLPFLTIENLEAGVPINLDVCYLYNDKILLGEWPDLSKDLQDAPEHTLNCLRLAIHQTILRTVPVDSLQSLLGSLNAALTVRLRLLNFKPVVCLRDLKINSYSKLISTRGCVIRVGRVKHLAQWFVFACTKCNSQRIVKQPEGVYTVPKRCDSCGVAKFQPVLNSPHVRSICFQSVRIQELLTDEQENKGRMPRVLDVELLDDLVNSCMPGDDITLTGIIKMQGGNDAASKGNTSTSFSLYMEALTIINTKHRAQSKDTIDNEMSIKDYLAIKEIYNEPNIFSLLVHSLCPSIYGHEMIKAGLMLSLFGGDAKHAQLRDDIHVLVVGDPGLGKSQMLQACARVASKGVYICGNSSTSSGLTVTLTKENGTNDFALEPGALVLADRGFCCIDEFDKMTSQHPALLESMEQQSVSVAKSGVLCSLPARTSILAAANPIGGRYDSSKTIVQNLNMSQPLLSRFDLVFLLLDRPDKYMDDLLCRHVMTMHTGLNGIPRSGRSFENESQNEKIKCTLRERLVSPSSRNHDTIPHGILRKYISYARQYVKPKLTDEAATLLQEYYLELRSKNQGFGGLPVFNRQLEAMIRLTEARAKLELRTEATEADAIDVIEILKYTMADTGDDVPQLRLSGSSDGRITNEKVQGFLKLLKKEASLGRPRIFTYARLNEIAEGGGIVLTDFQRFVSRLNEQGILLKTGINMYKFVID